jgi:phage-related minor tail protein
MDHKNEKEITNLELLESINRGFSRIEERMVTKEELVGVKNELKSDISSVRTELKTFKQETRDGLEEVNKNIDDLTEIVEDVVLNHGNRIEVIEEKLGMGLAV